MAEGNVRGVRFRWTKEFQALMGGRNVMRQISVGSQEGDGRDSSYAVGWKPELLYGFCEDSVVKFVSSQLQEFGLV